MKTRSVYHVIVYIPVEYADEAIPAITAQIPQLFGNYDQCAWWSAPGTGHFRPLEGANPTQGNIGKAETCEEIRLEFNLPHDKDVLEHMINKVIIPAHPWEEPVILIAEQTAPYCES